MNALRPMTFSHHAIERFVEWHRPDLTIDDARETLNHYASTAQELSVRSVLGDRQWEIPDLHVIAVCKIDQGADRPHCVTILPRWWGDAPAQEHATAQFRAKRDELDAIVAKANETAPNHNAEVRLAHKERVAELRQQALALQSEVSIYKSIARTHQDALALGGCKEAVKVAARMLRGGGRVLVRSVGDIDAILDAMVEAFPDLAEYLEHLERVDAPGDPATHVGSDLLISGTHRQSKRGPGAF